MAKIKNDCAIYLKLGSRKLRIPVNPSGIEIQYPTDHKKYNVLGKGEIVVPRKPSLKIVSWESFFPGDTSAPYTNQSAKTPEYYKEAIEQAMKKKQKCRLIITRSELYDTNMRCVISDFKTKDKGGEPTDMYYSLELTEYRDYSPKTVSVVITQTDSSESVQATEEQQREVETPTLRVGASVIANGKYWYSSYGAKPYGTANNLSTTVTRIVFGREYPICIGSYGWVQESQLQIVG